MNHNNSQKWREVFERLPIERKDRSLTDISGFTNFCDDSNDFCKQVFSNLSSELSPDTSLNICEVGCGCGDKLRLFYERNYDCFGLDYSKNMIERAKVEMPKADLYHGEARKLPFATNSMDFVFSFSVFLYFESKEYSYEVLSEMYRIAKPNATICIWDIPDIHYKDKVLQLRGEPEKGYEHTYYDMNDFIQWFKSKPIKSVKSEYFTIKSYKLSNYRFNITAKLTDIKSN